MIVNKNRQLKPCAAGKTAEQAHYLRLMKQGFNNSEANRIVGVGRQTCSHWHNGRTVRDPATRRIRSYPAITIVREQPAVIFARYLSEEDGSPLSTVTTTPAAKEATSLTQGTQAFAGKGASRLN